MSIVKELKVKIIDIDADKPICVLNTSNAHELFARPQNRINVTVEDNEVTCILDISDKLVGNETIGIFKEVAQQFNIQEGSTVKVCLMPYPKSIQFIIDKIRNKRLDHSQMSEIVTDVFNNKLSDIEVSSFMTATYINDLDLNETIAFCKALIEVGKELDFKRDFVLDKHSIGGINGRVSMLVIPIIASQGYWIPKTASRSISSAGGTADAMEVLAKVSFTMDEFYSIIHKVGGIVAWNGRLDLSPVDDKLIKVRHGLGLDPEGVVIASVLSKKKSAGATHLIIDLPVGGQVKILNKEDGERWAQKFLAVAKELDIKTKVVLTDAETPNGCAFGPALEAKAVLEILEGKYFDSLAEKACEIAGELFELVGKVEEKKGFAFAKQILESGQALTKFKEIIEAQEGHIFESKDVPVAEHKYEVRSNKQGKITNMDVHLLTKIARLAGAPKDKEAGVLLRQDVGANIEIDDVLFEIHANSKDKLDQTIKFVESLETDVIQLERIILEEIS